MSDINELAEKKLKSRMTKIRKCNREPAEKEKFSEKFGTSFEIGFYNGYIGVHKMDSLYKE